MFKTSEHLLSFCCQNNNMNFLFNLQTEYPRLESGRYVYRIHRSPMCEYMINFIHKLKHLPEKYMMNSVLENFTILQVCMRAYLARFERKRWYFLTKYEFYSNLKENVAIQRLKKWNIYALYSNGLFHVV